MPKTEVTMGQPLEQLRPFNTLMDAVVRFLMPPMPMSECPEQVRNLARSICKHRQKWLEEEVLPARVKTREAGVSRALGHDNLTPFGELAKATRHWKVGKY